MEEATNNTSLIFLDAMTTTGLRMTSFGREVEHCLDDFRSWTDNNHILGEHLAHADIYEKAGDGTPVNIGFVAMNADGDIIVAKPANPKEFVETQDPESKQMRKLKRALVKAFKDAQKERDD